MKIRKPDFTILDNYFKEDRLLEQIERCGRVCYKSEDRITEESAIPFIKGIIRRGHESVIEMAQIVCKVKAKGPKVFNTFFEVIPRFCQADRTGENEFIISGNPRSFRDLARSFTGLPLVTGIGRTIRQKWPVLFDDIALPETVEEEIEVSLLTPDEIDDLPTPLLVRHRTLLVHIVVNRAVTHELVRHRIASYLQESQRYCRYGEDRFGGEVAFIKPCFFDEGTKEYDLWKMAMEATEKIYLDLLKTSSPQAARTVLPNSCKTEIMVHATLEEWRHIFGLRASAAADPSMREIMHMIIPACAAIFPEVFRPIAEQFNLV
jgi:thymidylate synthase (FAD)